jgi:hypothetical protein
MPRQDRQPRLGVPLAANESVGDCDTPSEEQNGPLARAACTPSLTIRNNEQKVFARASEAPATLRLVFSQLPRAMRGVILCASLHDTMTSS